MNITKVLQNFPHNFLENALIGMINDLSLWMAPHNIPVFVLNTGDETFIADEKTMQLMVDNRTREALYQQRPRIVLDIMNIEFNRDEITSPHERARFVINDTDGQHEFSAKVQRVPMTVGVGLELFTDNILYAFKYTEILTMILSKHSTYEFTYLGKVYPGSYIFNYSMGDIKNLVMAQDAEKRNRILTTELSLQLAYPNFNIYRKYAGVGMPPPDGSFGNGLDGDDTGNNGLIIDPDLEDITDGGKRITWEHDVIDKKGTFQTKTLYDGVQENPIPTHQVIKPL